MSDLTLRTGPEIDRRATNLSSGAEARGGIPPTLGLKPQPPKVETQEHSQNGCATIYESEGLAVAEIFGVFVGVT